MRKRLIPPTPETVRLDGEGWLDLERAAADEVTSEEGEFPGRVCVGLGRDPGLACGYPGNSSHSAGLRSAAKAETHITCF